MNYAKPPVSRRENIIGLLNQYSDKDGNLIYGAGNIIAKEVGITRERVRQIAKRCGYITAQDDRNVFNYVPCLYCGTKFKRSHRKKFCSPNCNKEYKFQLYHDLVECKQCHFYFLANRKSVENRGRYFCSKTCQGKYIGEHYGVGTKGNSCGQAFYNTDNLEKDLTNIFTTKEFAEKYKYKSINGAYNAISALMLQKIIEPHRIRGMYQIKQKPVVDKNLGRV